jgi:hypothetical protein
MIIKAVMRPMLGIYQDVPFVTGMGTNIVEELSSKKLVLKFF